MEPAEEGRQEVLDLAMIIQPKTVQERIKYCKSHRKYRNNLIYSIKERTGQINEIIHTIRLLLSFVALAQEDLIPHDRRPTQFALPGTLQRHSGDQTTDRKSSDRV
jgi:hypothetical protein